MLADFYFRADTDPNFMTGVPQVHDEVEEAIYQTKMTLLTNKGDVLGEPGFGFNAIDYLFSLGPMDPAKVQGRAAGQLKSYALAANKYSVKVKAFMLNFADYTDGLGLDVSLGDLGSFGILYR